MSKSLQLGSAAVGGAVSNDRETRRSHRRQATPGPSTVELLDQVDAELRRPSSPQNFAIPLEEQFQAARAAPRIRHFVRMGMAGMASFDLFLFPDKYIFTDTFPLMCFLQLAIVTPVAVAILFLIQKRKVPPEAVFINICLTYGAVLYAAIVSHAPNALFVVFTLPIFLVFSNIGYPLPFRLASLYTVGCTLALAMELFWTGRLDVTVRILMLVIEFSVGAYTLIATYRLEAAERHAHLLTLRERLRGELLVEQNRALTDLSETDQLTGVANRRVFDRALEQLWSEHLQSRTPLALLMIDIDHFKRLNDTHGHAHGDVCLRKAADRLRCLMRPHQILARYGGEEFAVLLEGEGAYRAAPVAERLRAEIEALPIPLNGDEEGMAHRITISIGCATVIPRLDLAPSALFASADKALYAAKYAGRNRVCAHTIEPARETTAEVLESATLAPFATLWKN